MTRTATLAPDVLPTARELRWLAHIDRHGPQSSEFLYELTRHTHRCRDTTLRRLQTLREAGYLRLPPQQNQISRAHCNPHVYDLTPKGFEYLSYQQPLERHARPTGHWWHGLWVSAVSSSIEINATRTGQEYIPAARILEINGVLLPIPLRHGRVIPDQLFAIKSADGYRAYALEVDRGTEPVRSTAARKSLQRSVRQYREVLAEKRHQRHYGLRCNLIVLFVFMSAARKRQFEELLNVQDRAFRVWEVEAGFPRMKEFAHISNK